MTQKICLIEDDEILGEALVERLELEGFNCNWFLRGLDAIDALKKNNFNVVISDIQLPDISGESLYQQLIKTGTVLPPFLFITGYGTIDQAVNLLKMGAEDYITKPFNVAHLIEQVKSLTHSHNLDNGLVIPLGISDKMKALETLILQLSGNQSSVLISGPSGSGKEYVARAIHEVSDAENKKTFVALNCGAIPESLFEAELFGYNKGAFTGAVHNKRGFFEQANNGTLFLDEIGEMPLLMQVKLLRAIQENQITRIGSEHPVSINTRLICATNRDLSAMVSENTFRDDLYYRINVVNLEIPPLCERTEDILWHSQLFLSEYAHQNNNRRYTLNPKAEQALISYPWPGNIRELRNTLERACIVSQSMILTPETLFGDTWKQILSLISKHRSENLSEYVKECECNYIRKALAENEWRISTTADCLGISRKTLWDKMRKLGITETK